MMKTLKCEINDSPWEIFLVRNDDEGLLGGMNNFAQGMCWPRKHKIYISDEGPEEAQVKVLIHELCHAFLSEFDLDNKRETFTEEELCNFGYAHYLAIMEIVKEWKDGK